MFKQSPPGTPPHFGEHAYWFGPQLADAKAVTALESWPKRGSFLPGLLPNTPGRRITLRTGRRAMLYFEEYSQGNRAGVTADIVVDNTVCFIRGLVSPKTLIELAPDLRELGRAKP
jgi:hypothetical protein